MLKAKKNVKRKKICMDRDELIREHKNLVAVLRSPSHADDKVEAKKQNKELHEYIGKSFKGNAYIGPMSVADITLASWNEFFREGGSLNQPTFLQNDKLKDIERRYVRLARLHKPL
jgi:hypothetical protein